MGHGDGGGKHPDGRRFFHLQLTPTLGTSCLCSNQFSLSCVSVCVHCAEMPALPAFRLESVPGILSGCLDQAQRSAATHRKNIAICYKLLLASATVVEIDRAAHTTSRVGEVEFRKHWKRLALERTACAKKGLAPGDRVVKFIAAFVAHALEQDGECRPSSSCRSKHWLRWTRQTAAKQAQEGRNGTEASTPADRLASSTLKHLLHGFNAKDKTVRFRVTQMVATLISGITELECVHSRDKYSH